MYNENAKDYLTNASTFQDVTKVYRRVLLKIHPDKNYDGDDRQLIKSTELFKCINEAYELYSIQKQRK